MARLHSFYTSNAHQELNYVGQNLSEEDFEQVMKDYTNSLIFDADMFTEEVEEDSDDSDDSDDLFEDLIPIEDPDNDNTLTEDDSTLLVSDLINLNSVIGEEIEPNEVDHGDKEFDIDDIISNVGPLGNK